MLILLLLQAAQDVDIRPHALFADHMVLQSDVPAPVWGTAEPGRKVEVAIGGQRKSAVADKDGRWKVVLDPLQAGGPFELKAAGRTFRNVMVGEVWLCSGQSNMGWSVRLSANPAEEIAAAKHPKIRFFTVKRRMSETPAADVEGAWEECSPQTVVGFSAVAYHFGRELRTSRDVPIGLIHASWGATRAQAWTSRPVLESRPEFKDVFALYERERAAAAKGGPEPIAPASLYNGMIAPLAPYALRGTIWYQGEGNVGSPFMYRTLFPALIKDWRDAWGQGDFPFLYVQLASHLARKPEPVESYWAYLRESQTMALAVPKTGMAVAIDIGDEKDIHPKNKREVGRRLALAAEAVAYGKDVVHSGPLYDAMKIEGGKIRLSFKHAGGGLEARGGPLKGFAIAGDDRKFVWAEARIDGPQVLVWSERVPKPTAVQYAWADNPECALYNKEGLPAVPFRTYR